MIATRCWPLGVLLLLTVSCSNSKSDKPTGDGGPSGSGTGGSASSTGNSATGGAVSSGKGTGGAAGNKGTGGKNAAGTGGRASGTGGSVGTGGAKGTAGSGGKGSSGTGSGGTGGGNGGTGGDGNSGNGGNGGGGTSGANAGSGGGGGGFQGDVDLTESVLERGKDHQRTAHFVQSALTKSDVMTKMAIDSTFSATFSGNMSGVPLFLASTMAGKGLFFAATLNNRVYALNETTGATVWMHNLGSSAHGVISTPVIDASAHAIYVASDDSSNPIKHMIHALSVDSGNELAGWPVDVSTLTSGSYHFNSQDQNQRSALSLVGNMLYVAYGGYIGDGGDYRGWVVAVDTSDPTHVAGWATGGQQEGIWAAGGMASDGTGVFAITGNNGSAPTTHLDSEEVIRIDGMAVPHRDNPNLFYPSIWRSPMDTNDLDFGSCSPLVISATGGTPASLLVAPAKPGHLYLLNTNNLGGMGGQVRDLVVGDTGGQSVYAAPTAYKSPSGLRVALNVSTGIPCPGGSNQDGQMVGVLLDTSTPTVTASISWCAATSGDDDIRKRSPVSTTTDGTANPIVWFMNGAKLNAFDGESGAVLFDGGSGNCGGVHKFTSPIVAKGRVIAGGDGHLCSWSIH